MAVEHTSNISALLIRNSASTLNFRFWLSTKQRERKIMLWKQLQ